MKDKDQPEKPVETQDESLETEPVAEEIVEEMAEPEQTSPDDLTRLLEDARSKADEHWDQLTRAKAELENMRKRNQRDLENAHKFAVEKFSQDMLQVWDSLELATQSGARQSVHTSK